MSPRARGDRVARRIRLLLDLAEPADQEAQPPGAEGEVEARAGTGSTSGRAPDVVIESVVGEADGADIAPDRLADPLAAAAIAAAAEPEDPLRRFLDDSGDLEVAVGGIGIAGLARGDVLRPGPPGGEPLRRRAGEEEGRAERALDRRLDLGPHRLDDPAQPPDRRRALVDRLEIVADRLLARNVRKGAEDGGEEARAPRRRRSAARRTERTPGLGSI